MQVNKNTELQKQFNFQGFQVKTVDPELLLEFHELDIERSKISLSSIISLASTHKYLEMEILYQKKIDYLNR